MTELTQQEFDSFRWKQKTILEEYDDDTFEDFLKDYDCVAAELPQAPEQSDKIDISTISQKPKR